MVYCDHTTKDLSASFKDFCQNVGGVAPKKAANNPFTIDVIESLLTVAPLAFDRSICHVCQSFKADSGLLSSLDQGQFK